MAEPADTLLELGAATIGEAGGSAMAPRIRPVSRGDEDVAVDRLRPIADQVLARL